MGDALCREHAIVLEMELEGSAFERIIGRLDREITRSRDPIVQAFGDLISGIFTSRSSPQQPQQPRSGPSQRPRQPPPRPPPSSPPPNPELVARSVLGFEPSDRLTVEMVKKRKQALARVFHPDMPGGSQAQMQRVNDAADVLLAKLS